LADVLVYFSLSLTDLIHLFQLHNHILMAQLFFHEQEENLHCSYQKLAVHFVEFFDDQNHSSMLHYVMRMAVLVVRVLKRCDHVEGCNQHRYLVLELHLDLTHLKLILCECTVSILKVLIGKIKKNHHDLVKE
jgi:hypothetical protein